MSRSERQTLGIVFGGASVEHTISVRSACAVISATNPERWRVQPFAVDRACRWLEPAASQALVESFERSASEEVPLATQQVSPIGPETLAALTRCAVVFPLIHGASGEDGVLQGMLETLQIPYIGPGVAASAIAMDKARCKQLLREAGIPVAPWFLLSCEDWQLNPLEAMRRAADFDYPYFVKPARGGSSIGISKVHSREEASAAFVAAFACDREVLVEQAMPSPREIECGVLGALNNEDPIASPLGEIRTDRDFYDFTAKYEDPSTELIVPAKLDPELSAQLQELSLRAYRAIGAEGMLRADFLVSADAGAQPEVWLGEVNTIPGFTSVSMYPRLMEHAGIPMTEQIDRLVALASERDGQRQRLAGAIS